MNMNFVLINHRSIENPGDYLNYIYQFYNIAINMNNSRNDFTVLLSLITEKEERCLDSYCPLKKYINNSLEEFDNIFPLLQYCEKLFEFGIAKFSDDISLKINYSMFLIFEMNNNKKALITLNNIKSSIFDFQDNYNIYRCRILIDEYISKKNKNKNVINFFEYNKKINKLKILVSTSTSLYYDFWTLIIINKLNFSYNYDELNKLGSKIIKENIKIDEEFNSLTKIKNDNYELNKFYSQYIENVLNDKEKLKELNLKSPKISSTGDSNSEIQFYNFNLNALKEKDLVQYLILSGDKKNFAEIIDFSLSLCSIFGYRKNELIGKSINILIPELLIKMHNELLSKYHEKSKLLFDKELFENDNYIPDYLEKKVYAISKSKFLVPLKLKLYLVQTEVNEFAYIAEIRKIKDFKEIMENHDDNNLKYVVLTDENFYIYSFTSNCINNLMLNDLYINSNYNIINYINQLKNDYSNYIKDRYKENVLSRTVKSKNLDNYNKKSNINYFHLSKEDRKRIIKILIENYYLKEREINWKINAKTPKEDIDNINSLINYKESNLINSNNNYEREFKMKIKKIILSKELIGYYFIFRNKPEKDLYLRSNLFSSNISIINDQRLTSKIKSKRFNYLFEEKPLNKENSLIFNEREKTDIKKTKSPKRHFKFESFDKEEIIKNFNNNKIMISDNKNSSLFNNKSSKNFQSKYNTDINNMYKDKILINDNYIPESLFNFSFDINNRSYYPVFEANKEKKNILNEVLNVEATNKINNLKNSLKNKETKGRTKSSSNSQNSSSEEKESYSSSSAKSNYQNSEYSFEDNNNDNDSKNLKKSSSIKNKENINKEKIPDQTEYNQIKRKNILLNNYYKVNLNKIQFSIFDFNKEMTVNKDFEKESKIDKVIKKIKSRFSFTIKNTEEFTNIYNNIIGDKKESNSSGDDKNIKKQELNDKIILENKIKEAINKEEKEELIVFLNRYSIFLALTCITCTGLYLYYELNVFQYFVSVLGIIKDVISINYCNKIGLYFIRELTLLNIPEIKISGGNYSKISYSDKTEYNSFIKKNILELFIESQLSMIDFIGTSFSISKKGDNILTQTKLFTKLSKSDLSSNIIKNNLVITIIQLNSFFYNLASSTSPVQQNHDDLYGFVYNSLNNFGLAIKIIIDTYNKELELKCKSNFVILNIFLYTCLVIYIIIYLITIYLYQKIIKRKKSYIGIFFNLNFDFIIESIDRSEKFISKFKLLEENRAQEEEFIDSLEESKSLNQQEQNINIIKESSFNINKNIDIPKKKTQFKCSSSFIFQFFFAIFLIILYLIDIVFGYIYSVLLNEKVLNISKFYSYLEQFHLNIIEYYNIYREYLFDNTFMISNLNPYENLQQKERYIFGNWSNDVNNITYFIEKLINNKEIRDSLNKSLCYSYNNTDYFKSDLDCIKEIGNGFEQDIYAFCYGFVDDIRIKKNIIRVMLELNLIIGNLAEYQTETWEDKYFDLLNKGKNEDSFNKTIFRLDLFNDDYLHFSSNIIFINIILPFLNKQRKIIFDFLTINGKQNIYYLLFSLSTAGLFSIYFFYWVPMIRRLNLIIYETKNMLKLIPMIILVSDNNIKKILEIKFKD